MTYCSRLISFTFFVVIIALLTACQEKVGQLPVKKLSNKIWHKETKKQKELLYEGPHNFFEFHHQIRTRTGDEGPRYTTNYKQAALQKALQERAATGIAQSSPLDWQERGPGNVGGRTRGILVDKRDTTYLTWLVGAAGGGIWKTTDGGTHFELKTAEVPNMVTTTIAASDANLDIIYAGTGEGFFNQLTPGDGMYKSLDGGEHWTEITSTRNNPQFENILRLVVDPEDPNIVLAATRSSGASRDKITTNGHIMKSIDGGLSWTATYTIAGDTIATLDPAVQQIVADPTNFNILYATVRSIGILKSIDKGDTWTIIYDASTNVPEFGRMELAVSPKNPAVLHFATETANLFRSSDRGALWEIVPGEFGNWLGEQGWYNNAMAGNPYNENEVIVGGAGLLLSITSSADSLSRPILESVQNDTRFINLYSPFTDSAVLTINEFIEEFLEETPLPEIDTLVPIEIRFGPGRTQMAHRHLIGADIENTYLDYVEIPFEVWDNSQNRQLMVSFNDADGNGEWTINDVGIQFPDDNSRELLVFHALDYDPDRPAPELNSIINRGYYAVFAGTFEGTELNTQILPIDTIFIKTFVRNTRNSTFRPIADGYGEYNNTELKVYTRGVHVDHHNLVLIPENDTIQNFYIINANDGGIAFSRNAGENFVQTGDTFKDDIRLGILPLTYPTNISYNTSLFYGIDKMNGEDRYIGGTQDNGSWVSAVNPGMESIWITAAKGDGFETAWNYGNPDLLLASAQFNTVFRSEDRGLTWNPVNLPGNAPFITRIEASKQDPDLVFGISALGILKSTDFGLNWSVAEMPAAWQFNGLGNPIAISEASPEVVWTGGQFDENVGLIVSADGGNSFQATNGYDRASLGPITNIATHPFNQNNAYALFSMADGPKILATTDLGQTWTDLSGFGTNQLESNNGFPDVATFSLLVMPFDTNQIWAGTEIGLFESLDGGASWQYADNGLPPVLIYEMKIVNDQVILATHGRGIWSVNLPELEGYEPLSVSIGPLVNITENGFNGQIVGEANLRAAYDSTILEVFLPLTEEPVLIERTVFAGNATISNTSFEFQVNLTRDTIISAIVQLTAYIDGEVLIDQNNVIIYNVDETEVVTYSDDFDSGNSDFARLGFNIYQEADFNDQALHSAHPYPGNNQESMAIFQKPIRVEEATSLLTFDEVVLVEFREAGSPDFLDFVTVEATKDNGQTWVTLDKYDTNRADDWIRAYEIGFNGNANLIQSHQIGLSGFFEAGEVIYLRFRLVADALVEGWGWMIDNLALKSELTAVKELPALVALKNFPNPFTTSTILTYNLPQQSEVQAALYSLDGKLLSHLFQATQLAGLHRYQVNTSSLESGIYICRFRVGDTEKTLKWFKY